MSDEIKEVEVVEPVKETCLAKIKETGLETTKGQMILDKFSEYFKLASDWETKVKTLVITDVSQVAEMKMAREGRLFLKKKRCEADNIRKEMKEGILREGKAIDGIYNVLKALIVPLEEYLDSQEKYAERLQEEKKTNLRAKRISMLEPYGVDISVYSDLGEMEGETFENILLMSEKAYHEKQEALRKEETDRIAREKAEAEEREKIKLENIKLKAEAAEARKLKAENDARMEKERKEREKLETELKAKAEAEAKAKAKQEAEANAKRLAEEKLKTAPDKTKLIMLAKAISKFNYPEMSSEDGEKTIKDVKELFAKIVNFINERVNKI